MQLFRPIYERLGCPFAMTPEQFDLVIRRMIAIGAPKDP